MKRPVNKKIWIVLLIILIPTALFLSDYRRQIAIENNFNKIQELNLIGKPEREVAVILKNNDFTFRRNVFNPKENESYNLLVRLHAKSSTKSFLSELFGTNSDTRRVRAILVLDKNHVVQAIQ